MIRLLLVLGLLVALPGFLLVQALMPPGRVALSWAERALLALVGGVVLVTLVGLALGFWPHGDEGHLQTWATGRPNAEAVILAVSLLLAYVGYSRGAYPGLSRRIEAIRGA